MKRTILTVLAALIAFASLASIASGTPEERAAYKTEVEPICKTNKEASEKYLKGVKTMVKNNKLKQAGTAFSKAAAALEKAQKALAAVHQPPEDSAKLTKWLSDIKGEVSLMKTIAAKFKAGDKSKGSSLTVKLTHNANVANSLVIAYQFDNCKIDPSKFS
jgi:hypothetical protein